MKKLLLLSVLTLSALQSAWAESALEYADKAASAYGVYQAGALATAVQGASGPAIMGQMSAAGSVLGTGGVIAAPALAGGGAGLGAAHLMNETLYSNCQNQHACDAAKTGTYSGAVAGTVASTGALVAVGAGPAGLATIGATVGGGMAAGAATVVLLPVAAAAAVGGVVYWAVSD